MTHTSRPARKAIIAHYAALAGAADEAQLRQIVTQAGELLATCMDYDTVQAFAAELPYYGIDKELLHGLRIERGK